MQRLPRSLRIALEPYDHAVLQVGDGRAHLNAAMAARAHLRQALGARDARLAGTGELLFRRSFLHAAGHGGAHRSGRLPLPIGSFYIFGGEPAALCDHSWLSGFLRSALRLLDQQIQLVPLFPAQGALVQRGVIAGPANIANDVAHL